MKEIAIVMLFLITAWMLKLWLAHRVRMKELALSARGVGAAEERLARVEHAVDAIAVEVERIGEGQRYVTAVLAEHSPPARVPEGRAAAPVGSLT